MWTGQESGTARFQRAMANMLGTMTEVIMSTNSRTSAKGNIDIITSSETKGKQRENGFHLGH